MAWQSCHSLLLSLCLHRFGSQLFQPCKTLLFLGQWPPEISSHFIYCEEYDPKLTAYLQIALLTLAQCLPPGQRGLQLGSVKIVLLLYQNFSFHYAPAEIVCLC